MTRPRSPSLGIEGFLGLSATCIRCGAERELEGSKAPAQRVPDELDTSVTCYVEAPEPCGCGATRVKVKFDLEIF